MISKQIVNVNLVKRAFIANFRSLCYSWSTLFMAKRIILLVIILAIGAGLFFAARYFLGNQKQQGKAGLQVKSEPPASVFLDSRFLGRTPYEDRIEQGDYTLKLIPESTATSAASWQGKVTLTANILTFVNRELGTSDLNSSGEVISLERLTGRDTEISVITTPDSASVKIDGTDKGIAPLLLRNVEPGEHEIVVTSPGFITRLVKVKATAGFKLTASVQLGISGQGDVQGTTTTITPTEESKKTDSSKTATIEKPYIEILDTPTGFLRVRSEPSTTASESGRVNPKEKYPLLDEKSGWYKIKLLTGEGWVSGRYAQKFE